MAGIGELSVSVTARTQKAVANINGFRRSINATAGPIAGVTAALGGLVTAAAGLITVRKMVQSVKKSFEEIDKLAKTADKLGIGTEKLQALRFAAEETTTGGVALLDKSLEKMVVRLSEAAQGTGTAADAVAELGLNASVLNQMSPDQQFVALSEAIKGVTNSADRARIAYDVFGREGVALVNTLKIGRKGLEDYEKAANDLGITVSRFDAAQIEKANDAFGRIGKVVEGVSNKIAIGLAPVVEGVSRSFTDWSKNAAMTSASVTDSMHSIAKAVGFVRNGIEFWNRAFNTVRANAAELFAWMARKVQQLSVAIADAINKIPGIETKPLDFTGAFADEMEGAAIRARAAADHAWRQPLPSEGIDAMFNKFKTNIDNARKEFDALAKQDRSNPFAAQTNKMLGDQAKGIGALIAKISHGATKMIDSSVEKMAGLLSQNEQRQEEGILDARSAEGFAQLRANLGKTGGTQEKILDQQKKEVAVTQQVVNAVNDLVRKLPIPEILSFGDA